MIVVVSPYHLTTREPPAMASLLLAEQVVTLLPAPPTGGGAAQAMEAATRSPAYRRLVESWHWLMPLWKAGVVASRFGGESLDADFRRVCERIDRDQALIDLRPFMKPGLFDEEKTYLDAVSADVLKGGPDPGICVPVAAGLDRFAARHALWVARSHPTSVAQQAEARMGARLFAVGVPAVIQADGERILEVRDWLKPELVELRAAIVQAAGVADPAASHADAPAIIINRLSEAARAYAAAFEARRAEILDADGGDLRVVEATVTLMGVRLPVDSVLRSSTTAARVMVGAGARTPRAEDTRLPAVWEPGDGGFVNALVVKKIGAAAPRRR